VRGVDLVVFVDVNPVHPILWVRMRTSDDFSHGSRDVLGVFEHPRFLVPVDDPVILVSVDGSLVPVPAGNSAVSAVEWRQHPVVLSGLNLAVVGTPAHGELAVVEEALHWAVSVWVTVAHTDNETSAVRSWASRGSSTRWA